MKLLLFLLIPFVMFSQTFKMTEYQHGSDLELYFVASNIDSGIVASGEFKLNQFDNFLGAKTITSTDDSSTYGTTTTILPSAGLAYYYELDTLAANDEIVSFYVQGKFTNGTWATIDTILASDTLNASHAGLTGAGFVDLDANDCIYPLYRVCVEGLHDLGNTYTAKLSLYAYKRD